MFNSKRIKILFFPSKSSQIRKTLFWMEGGVVVKLRKLARNKRKIYYGVEDGRI